MGWSCFCNSPWNGCDRVLHRFPYLLLCLWLHVCGNPFPRITKCTLCFGLWFRAHWHPVWYKSGISLPFTWLQIKEKQISQSNHCQILETHNHLMCYTNFQGPECTTLTSRNLTLPSHPEAVYDPGSLDQAWSCPHQWADGLSPYPSLGRFPVPMSGAVPSCSQATQLLAGAWDGPCLPDTALPPLGDSDRQLLDLRAPLEEALSQAQWGLDSHSTGASTNPAQRLVWSLTLRHPQTLCQMSPSDTMPPHQGPGVNYCIANYCIANYSY